jgi:hypothetical protein
MAKRRTRCGMTRWRVQLKRDGTRWRREGKWRGNWRIEWVASTLHTTSEHGVSSITTADPHTSAASSRLNWRPCRFKWTRPFRRKTKPGFCAWAITFQTQSITNRLHYWVIFMVHKWFTNVAHICVFSDSLRGPNVISRNKCVPLRYTEINTGAARSQFCKVLNSLVVSLACPLHERTQGE